MDNDYFNYYNDEDDDDVDFESQQFIPGGFRIPQDPNDRNQMPPWMQPEYDMDMPRSVNQPTSAPPNFIPEMPRMGDGQQTFGAPGYGDQFRGGGFNQPRSFRRCLNRFTFIWLINGNSFWFFPVFVGRQHVEGFRWRNGRWVYDRINLRRILFFNCY